MNTPLRRAVMALAVLALQALSPASRGAAPDVITPDGGRYYGPLVNGRLHGHGRIEWPSGAWYEGDFVDGVAHGRGRGEFANGSRYESEMRDGMLSGYGELRHHDGRKYRGDFVRGELEGKGRFEEPEGDVYEGEFKNGAFTGTGRHTRKDGARYEGAFRNWRYQGPGRYIDARGDVYEGNFDNGSLEGRGKVTTKESVYEGDLKAWRYHGRGVLRHANGDVYEGEFEYGFYGGQGTLTYGNPRADGQKQLSGLWRYGQPADDAERLKAQADLEAAMYAQQKLLDGALASVKRSQPGKINMYLLAVAGDGTQEVFRREVQFVQKAFADRFGTGGRSVALVNSRTTLASAPMATLTSIRAALQTIAKRMNRDNDILFLFLTSHGSADHQLSLSQRAMQLRDLRAAELAALVKETGIRWKVIVVSACYSGGFIDALQDERTLVITAARNDRRSFGCADENDFTYFGRAFFKEALPRAHSFQQAFGKAALLVEQWESKGAAKEVMAAGKQAQAAGAAHSLPQIRSPAAIEGHLRRWWSQLPPGHQ